MAISIAWRTGVNMREFAFYGPEFLPFTQVILQNAQLSHLSDLGVKLVRLYAVHARNGVNENVDRVRRALNLLDRHDMQGIVCLTDALGSAFIVRGDEPYHTQVHGHFDKRYWHESRFRESYLPQVRALVTALSDHPGLLMWELGNEIAIHPQPASGADADAFFNFAREISGLIKGIAPHNLVSTGLVNTNHIAAAGRRDQDARRLYALPTIDAISIHFYQHDGERDHAALDLQVAREVDKPFYIGEMGAFHDAVDRVTYYRDEIAAWRAAGAFTVLPWAFDTSPIDVGIADTLAFAARFPDFPLLREVIKSFAVAVARFYLPRPEPEPQPTPPPLDEPKGAVLDPLAGGKPPIATKRFVVTAAALNVRPTPSLNSQRIGLIAHNAEVIVDADTRLEVDGFVWWKHDRGWSAERTLNDGMVLMVEVAG